MESIKTQAEVLLTPEQLAQLTFSMSDKDQAKYFMELARLQNEKVNPSGNKQQS